MRMICVRTESHEKHHEWCMNVITVERLLKNAKNCTIPDEKFFFLFLFFIFVCMSYCTITFLLKMYIYVHVNEMNSCYYFANLHFWTALLCSFARSLTCTYSPNWSRNRGFWMVAHFAHSIWKELIYDNKTVCSYSLFIFHIECERTLLHTYCSRSLFTSTLINKMRINIPKPFDYCKCYEFLHRLIDWILLNGIYIYIYLYMNI